MCDVKGCWRLPYCEVYPINKDSWSYLCKKHFREEFTKYGLKYGWYMLKWHEIPNALYIEFRSCFRRYKIW